jgi:chromosome segregation ATPase
MNELSTVSVKDMAPEQLGGEIRLLTAQARRMALSYGIQIGYRLKIAHEKVGPHGWAEWLKRETEFSAAAASRFEALYEGYGDEQGSIFGVENKFPTLENLSISNALRLLAIPEEEREDFALEVDAEHLSARELEAKVKERTAEIEAKAQRWEEKAGEYASQVHDLQNEFQDALKQRNDEEQARAEAEEQLRRIKAELDEIEKRPQTVALERDEAAIAEAVKAERERLENERAAVISKAANDAADLEREKHREEEKRLKAKIEELEEQAKKNTENPRSAHDDIRKAKADARDAREAVQKAQQAEAEAERLRGDIEALRKQLSMAAPEVAEFKAAFERVQREFSAMLETLDKIQDGETKGKLRAACAAVLDGFMGRVKE